MKSKKPSAKHDKKNKNLKVWVGAITKLTLSLVFCFIVPCETFEHHRCFYRKKKNDKSSIQEGR